jgi:hypothetical protein
VNPPFRDRDQIIELFMEAFRQDPLAAAAPVQDDEVSAGRRVPSVRLWAVSRRLLWWFPVGKWLPTRLLAWPVGALPQHAVPRKASGRIVILGRTIMRVADATHFPGLPGRAASQGGLGFDISIGARCASCRR